MRPSPPSATSPSASPFVAALALLALAIGVHATGLRGAFVFDDFPAIRDNATIRSLWPLSTAFSPPQNSGVGGRPLANFSFALNYAISGLDVRGFHAGSLLLHGASTLLLFGILRRTRARSVGPRDQSGVAWPFVIAAMWSVHPLTTASVAYVSQRTELLMACCYLLTLYAFIRATEQEPTRTRELDVPAAQARRGWLAVAVVACALGMMSKEVMVTAPAMVLLYDSTFVTGSIRAALRRRPGFYAALAATWLVLAYLLTSALEQRSVGFGLGVSPWKYAAAEAGAILTYLRLSFFPQPLIFDYGPIYSANLLAIAAVAALLVLAVGAFRRGGALGLVGAAFFILLAPTSSFVPVAEQPVAENRMYLPLAIVLIAATAGAAATFKRGSRTSGTFAWLAAAACGAVIVTFAAITFKRTRDYRSESTLWADTVAKRPQNPRATYNYGIVLLDAGHPAEAIGWFQRTIALKPTEAKAHNSLGNALLELGRPAEAVPHFAEAVRLQPNYARAWFNYATALLRQHEAAQAIDRFETVLRLRPDWAEAELGLGNAHFELGRLDRAITHYAAALRLDPSLADAHYNGGSALLELGRIDDAIRHFTAAAKLKPGDAEIRNNLAAALLRSGRVTDAIGEFEHALRLKPDYADARDNLELARRMLARGR